MALRALYSNAFRLYKLNPILLLPSAVGTALSALMAYYTGGGHVYGAGAATAPLSISFLVGIALTCGSLGMTKACLAAKKTSLDDFSSAIEKSYTRFLLAGIISIPIILAPALPLVASLAILFFFQSGGALMWAVLLASLVALAAVLTLISFYPQALLADDLGPLDSIKKSAAFVRAKLSGALLLWLSILAFYFVVFLPPAIIEALLPGQSPVLTYLIAALVSPLVSLVTMDFYMQNKS